MEDSIGPKQSTLDEILESERELVLGAAGKYGDYYANASEFNGLLQTFVKSADPDRFVFAMFLSQIRKHATLALWSAVRLHHVQTSMNLRQVLEAGACAAYAIANPDPADFADMDETGVANASQDLTKKRYAWLDRNYRHGSRAIRNLKKTINAASAHSNIVYAHKTFEYDPDNWQFKTPFFDIEDELAIKTDLWTIANIIMGLVDLFYGVNTGRNVIKFDDDFVPRLKALEKENHRLKAEMMKNPRVSKWATSIGETGKG